MAAFNVKLDEENANMEDGSLNDIDPLSNLDRMLEEMINSRADTEDLDVLERDASTPLQDEQSDTARAPAEPEAEGQRLDTPLLPDSPPPPYESDDAPPPYGPYPPVSPISNSNETWDSYDEYEEEAVIRPWVEVEINSWRSRAAGLLWHVTNEFRNQGHVAISHELMRNMYRNTLLVDENPGALGVVVATLQSISTIGGAEFIFNSWSHREGRSLPARVPLPNVVLPSIQPWNAPGFWEYDLWSLIVSILNHLLAQGTPATEDAFLDTIRDCFTSAGGNPWIVGLAVFTAYYIYRTPWFWSILFRQ